MKIKRFLEKDNWNILWKAVLLWFFFEILQFSNAVTNSEILNMFDLSCGQSQGVATDGETGIFSWVCSTGRLADDYRRVVSQKSRAQSPTGTLPLIRAKYFWQITQFEIGSSKNSVNWNNWIVDFSFHDGGEHTFHRHTIAWLPHLAIWTKDSGQQENADCGIIIQFIVVLLTEISLMSLVPVFFLQDISTIGSYWTHVTRVCG